MTIAITSRAEIRPFISVLLLLLTLFFLVFFKMEVRRMGYEVLKQDRLYKSMQDQLRFKSIRFAEAIRPDRVKRIATRNSDMQTAKSGQIIYLSERGVAVPQ